VKRRGWKVDRRLIGVTAVLFVIGVLADVVIDYSPVPGYAASIGLFACIGLVVVSKWLGAVLLDRPSDYYPDDEVEDPQLDVLPAGHPDADHPEAGEGARG
jgi:hypothetical protein